MPATALEEIEVRLSDIEAIVTALIWIGENIGEEDVSVLKGTLVALLYLAADSLAHCHKAISNQYRKVAKMSCDN